MRYVLDQDYRLRGYQKLPTGLLRVPGRKMRFFPKDLYRILLRCNGVYEFEPEQLEEKERDFLQALEKQGVVHAAGLGEMLLSEQMYHLYPAEYRKECHWSITGCCNLRCRHCFMSAPQARHGAPDWEQLVNIADQLAECGVLRVGITGGEPLIRGIFSLSWMS